MSPQAMLLKSGHLFVCWLYFNKSSKNFQIKYLNFKVLALGIVNEEGEVFFPYGFIGFVPNLKETAKCQLCDILCGKGLPRLWLFIYCVWKLRMTLIKFQDTYLLSMCYYVLIVKSVQRWR